jgi:hypothetical protein
MAANCRAFGGARSLSSLYWALEGFEGQEYVSHTPSLILKVDTLWLAGLAGKRLSHLGGISFS